MWGLLGWEWVSVWGTGRGVSARLAVRPQHQRRRQQDQDRDRLNPAQTRIRHIRQLRPRWLRSNAPLGSHSGVTFLWGPEAGSLPNPCPAALVTSSAPLGASPSGPPSPGCTMGPRTKLTPGPGSLWLGGGWSGRELSVLRHHLGPCHLSGALVQA